MQNTFLNSLILAFLLKYKEMFPLSIKISLLDFFNDVSVKKDQNYNFYESYIKDSNFKFITRTDSQFIFE